ncbi:MAG: ribulose-phosphate 3-epimerase [Coriobacteriia bacterium]|nr:ribulose-phosphate 3-epimerase [Coriobacteriia bacterium]
MFQPVQIAPSILSADFMNFAQDIDMIREGGAGYIHFDVIDGHFAPNMTVGVPVLKQLRKHTDMPIDVHLMITNPLVQLPWFLACKPDMVTVHAEALTGEGELQQAVDMIHEAGSKACVSVKPKTPVEVLEPVMAQLDMVLVMSVEPGFSGQSYIEGTDQKVRAVVEMARAAGSAPLIQVDGGMGLKTAPLVAAEGADVIVCGNAVFGAEDPKEAIRTIAAAADEARLAALAKAEA